MDKFLKTSGPIRTAEIFTMPIVSRKYKKERKNLKKIYKDDMCYIYNDGTVRFEFSMLSDYVKDDLSVQELQSYNRYYNDCYKNLKTARLFENSSIIVGFVVAGEETYLHSWVEYESTYGKKVVDYTKNLIMNDSDYYNLMKADKVLEFNSDNHSKYIQVFQNSEELDNTVWFPIYESEIDNIRNQLILSRNK